MRTFLSILLCLILSSLNSSSGNEIFKHLTINDGLAHTDANCVAQDSTGLMWLVLLQDYKVMTVLVADLQLLSGRA